MGHDRKASVAVVGGGIGGLAAAAFLRRAGLEATVYEQTPTPRLGDVGAGLIVAPNAARLLRRLPSAVTLEHVGVVLEAGWEFRRWADGRVLFAQQLGQECARRYGEYTWTAHRADLLEVLRSAVGDEAIELGRGPGPGARPVRADPGAARHPGPGGEPGPDRPPPSGRRAGAAGPRRGVRGRGPPQPQRLDLRLRRRAGSENAAEQRALTERQPHGGARQVRSTCRMRAG